MPIVFTTPVQLSMTSAVAFAVKLAKLSVPTVPLPKSRCDPVAVRVSAPSPSVLVPLSPADPSLKLPLAIVPPPSETDRRGVIDLIVRA